MEASVTEATQQTEQIYNTDAYMRECEATAATERRRSEQAP